MKADVLNKHEARFLDWLGQTHPDVKNYIIGKSQQGLSGFADSLAATINNVVSGASNVLQAYVQGKAQVDLIKVNWDRAKAGQAPFNTVAEYQAALRSPIQRGASFGLTILKSPYFWVAVGVGAFLLIRGRRR